MSEERQVAIEVQGVYPQGENSLRGQSWPGKAPRPPPGMTFASLCLYMFAAGIYFGTWHDANGCGEIPTTYNAMCLSHGDALFYWAFSSVGCHEDDFFLSYIVS